MRSMSEVYTCHAGKDPTTLAASSFQEIFELVTRRLDALTHQKNYIRMIQVVNSYTGEI